MFDCTSASQSSSSASSAIDEPRTRTSPADRYSAAETSSQSPDSAPPSAPPSRPDASHGGAGSSAPARHDGAPRRGGRADAGPAPPSARSVPNHDHGSSEARPAASSPHDPPPPRARSLSENAPRGTTVAMSRIRKRDVGRYTANVSRRALADCTAGAAWGRGEVYVREILWGRRLLVPDRFIFPVAILFSKLDESSHAARPSLVVVCGRGLSRRVSRLLRFPTALAERAGAVNCFVCRGQMPSAYGDRSSSAAMVAFLCVSCAAGLCGARARGVFIRRCLTLLSGFVTVVARGPRPLETTTMRHPSSHLITRRPTVLVKRGDAVRSATTRRLSTRWRPTQSSIGALAVSGDHFIWQRRREERTKFRDEPIAETRPSSPCSNRVKLGSRGSRETERRTLHLLISSRSSIIYGRLDSTRSLNG